MIQCALCGHHDFVQVERFGDKVVGAQTDGFDCAVARTVRSHDDHRDGGQPGMAVEILKNFLPANLGHLPIAENEVRNRGAQQLDGSRTIISFQGLVSAGTENFG
jgi:hypothetical protein